MEVVIFVWAYSFCYKAIKKYRKYHWVLIDDIHHKTVKDIPKGIFDEMYFVDLSDYKKVDVIVSQIEEKYTIKAIMTTYEKTVELVGFLRSKHNVSGLNELQSRYVRDKYLMKTCVRNLGIKTARFEKAEDARQALDFIKRITLPVIIKPVNGFGTINTIKIENMEEWHEFAKRNDSWPILIEEYIRGKEFHCDSIVVDGEVIFSSVGEYLYPLIETLKGQNLSGSIIYPDIDPLPSFIESIKIINRKVIKGLGIINSICHAEMFLTEQNQVVFNEIAARIGGGPLICPCIKNTHGVDFFEAFVRVELHDYGIQTYKKGGPYTGNVCFPSRKGIITEISKLEDFSNFDGLVSISILNKVGDIINDMNDTMTRTGAAIIEDFDKERLFLKLKKIIKEFKLETMELK